MHLFKQAACCSKPGKVVDPSRSPPIPTPTPTPPTGKYVPTSVQTPTIPEKKEECTIM
jgi:hypothetical protein